MTPAPTGAPVVRDDADDRIDEGVHDQRRADREADQIGRRAQHLIVEEEKQSGDAGVLDAPADRAESQKELRPRAAELALVASRRRFRHHVLPAAPLWARLVCPGSPAG